MPYRLKFGGDNYILLPFLPITSVLQVRHLEPTCQTAAGKITRKGKDSAVDLMQVPAHRVAAFGIARLFLRFCVLAQQRVLCAACECDALSPASA